MEICDKNTEINKRGETYGSILISGFRRVFVQSVTSII